MTRDFVMATISAGRTWFWEAPDGRVVHLTSHTGVSFGVARIGPVYTPEEHRGRGYAGRAVAEVSAALRRSGARVCLSTDVANAVSNRVYQRIGYRSVADFTNLLIDPAG